MFMVTGFLGLQNKEQRRILCMEKSRQRTSLLKETFEIDTMERLIRVDKQQGLDLQAAAAEEVVSQQHLTKISSMAQVCGIFINLSFLIGLIGSLGLIYEAVVHMGEYYNGQKHGKMTSYFSNFAWGYKSFFYRNQIVNYTYEHGKQVSQRFITSCPNTAYYSKEKALAAFQPIKVIR